MCKNSVPVPYASVKCTVVTKGFASPKNESGPFRLLCPVKAVGATLY